MVRFSFGMYRSSYFVCLNSSSDLLFIKDGQLYLEAAQSVTASYIGIPLPQVI